MSLTSRDRVDRVASACLTVATLLVIWGMSTGFQPALLVALPLVMTFSLLCLPRMGRGPRMLFGAAAIAVVLFLILGDAGRLLANAGQIAYLPGLIAVLSILRFAVQTSTMADRSGRFIVAQPPGRRYIMLAIGATVFCILLSFGGLALLMGMGVGAARASGREPRVVEIQTRRISRAVMLGFGSTLLWSPLGIGLNLCLTFFPELTWRSFAPLGFAFAFGFLTLGWLFDRLEKRPRTTVLTPKVPGGALALTGMFGLVVAVALSAMLLEALLGIPLRGALLIVVPLCALIWAAIDRTGTDGPTASAAGLMRRSVIGLPASVNEVTLLTSAGCLGIVVAAALPEAWLLAALEQAHGSRVLLTLGIVVPILVLALIGLNPMVTATAILSVLTSVTLPMPAAQVSLAVLLAWAAAMACSPVTATVTIASGITGAPPSRIALAWNGPAALTFAGLGTALLLLLSL